MDGGATATVFVIHGTSIQVLSALLIRSEMIHIFAGEETFPRQMWSTLMKPLIGDIQISIACFTMTYRKTADLNDRGKLLSCINSCGKRIDLK